MNSGGFHKDDERSMYSFHNNKNVFLSSYVLFIQNNDTDSNKYVLRPHTESDEMYLSPTLHTFFANPIRTMILIFLDRIIFQVWEYLENI